MTSSSAACDPVRIAIAIVQQDEFILVGQRALDIELGGLAEFPGGKVEPGESPEDAAARECLEETGIEVSIERLCHRCKHDYEHDRLELHFFYARPATASASPRHPFRWVRREELRSLPFPAANQAVLQQIAK